MDEIEENVELTPFSYIQEVTFLNSSLELSLYATKSNHNKTNANDRLGPMTSECVPITRRHQLMQRVKVDQDQ